MAMPVYYCVPTRSIAANPVPQPSSSSMRFVLTRGVVLPGLDLHSALRSGAPFQYARVSPYAFPMQYPLLTPAIALHMPTISSTDMHSPPTRHWRDGWNVFDFVVVVVSVLAIALDALP
eukprot:2129254-Rhodomonas_salina.1